MTEPERNHLSGRALEAYDRMLERVQARLSDMENTTRDTLKDLEHLLHFVEETGEGLKEWLQLDISLLEHQLADMLFSVADKTRLDTLELNQKLENHEPSQYISGEVATAGMFKCLNCSHMRCLTATSHLEPCDACGSHYYERVTSRWPRKSE